MPDFKNATQNLLPHRFPFGLLILLCLLSLVPVAGAEAHILDLRQKQVVTLQGMITDLSGARVVFIGESHDQVAHHQAQLQVIRGLKDAGAEVAVGLEMFRNDGQPELDRWVAGALAERDFVPLFNRHWGGWSYYREIFLYARQQKIPLVGLNIPRQVVHQVAREGFASLSDEVRAELPLATCNVNPMYRHFLRGVLNGHPLEGTAYEHFCEAQILWDASMARHLKDYLERHPQHVVVVLAGNGHAWRHGIAEHLGDYADSMRVLLPEVAGWLEQDLIDAEVADYLLQGVELGPLH